MGYRHFVFDYECAFDSVIIVCDDSLTCVVCGNAMLNVGTRRDPNSITIYHFVEISKVGTENCDIQLLIRHCAEALFNPVCMQPTVLCTLQVAACSMGYTKLQKT